MTPAQRLTLTMVLLNALMTPLMLSAVNVGLPAIALDLSMSAVSLSWVQMAYLMASAMFVLIFGRLADMTGRKRLFLAGTASVIVTSLLAALARDALTLIAARFLQGIGAAMLYATQVAIVSSIFPPQRRGRAIGLTAGMIYLGLTLGPLLGGALIDQFGWRAAFLAHIPLAVVALLIGLCFVKAEWRAADRGRFDPGGALLYAGSICILCLGVSRLPGAAGLGLLFIAGLGLILFFCHERRHAHPVLNVALFSKNRVFTFSCLASLILYTATFANVIQVSLYLQYLKGLSATFAGLVMLCQPLTMALISPLAGRLSDRFEPRYIASLGTAISAAGLVLLANLQVESGLAYLILALALTGLGFSLFSAPNINAIIGSAGRQAYGSANGVVATMRILGQMSSMALVMLVFALTLGAAQITAEHYAALESAIRLSFTVAAILCLPGLYFSLIRGKMRAD